MTIDARYSMRGYFSIAKDGAYIHCRIFSGPLGYGMSNGVLLFPVTEWTTAKEKLSGITWYEDEQPLIQN